MSEISAPMMEWMKAIATSVGVVDEKMDKAEVANAKQHNDLGLKIDAGHLLLHQKHDKLREEFVIHKTKINTKTYMISVMIGAAFTIATLTISIVLNKKKQEVIAPVQTELVIPKQTTYGI
ncbi:unnamed protein product [marine sediment metagenome]|uniref:Uncharacterized protein n=1 Tax=marine sediment metagenome TaxID=412755 RepID=X0XGF6_9ZZZZ